MPELPEVETTLRGITPHLEQQIVADVIIRQRQLRWPIPATLKPELTGQRIQRVFRRGKYLLVQAEHGCVLLHLGMSGNLRILPATTPPLKHDHFDIVLSSGQCLRFNDPRRFGCVLWTTMDPAEHKLLKNLGVEPLTAEFTAEYLWQQSRNKKIAIKQFMMNSKIVVGVGNIYACEALFAAGILPTRSAASVTKVQYEKLTAAIKKILQRSIDIGGTTLRDFVNSEGKPGYFKQQLNVYGRDHQPCKTCSTVLTKAILNNRATVYCCNCQK